MQNRIILLSLISFLTFSACRKGEEDSFFSIHTRKQRLCGEWVVKKFKHDHKESQNDITTYIHSKSLTDGTFKEINSINNIMYTGTYVSEYSINKNGTYKIDEKLFCKSPFDTTISMIENGNWYFVDKNKAKEYKNKEVVAFQPTSIVYSPTNTYTLSEYNPYFYEIVKLKNKEIKLIRSYTEKRDTIKITINEEIQLEEE